MGMVYRIYRKDGQWGREAAAGALSHLWGKASEVGSGGM